MKKEKIAICFQDKEYQERFLKCWVHHFGDGYEVHVLNMEENAQIHDIKYDLILLEGEKIKELNLPEMKDTKIIYLTEKEEFNNEAVEEMFKYREIYKIEQRIRKHLSGNQSVILSGKSPKKIIGVFSLDAEIYQVPFCALLAAEYGEREACILLDLQVSSGLEGGEGLALDDIFVSLATKACKKSQLQDAIISEKGWGYINPIRNSECVAELNKELCEELLQVLEEEIGYHIYVINFGQMFEGCMEWMYTCDCVYMLVYNKEQRSRREQAFLQELKRHGVENLQQKIFRVEIPGTYHSYEAWRSLAEKWRWNEIGDQVRLHMQLGG